MNEYQIIKLKPENYHKCSNIWDMKKYPDRTETWYKQIVEGSREVYVYLKDDEYIGEIAFFSKYEDPDYYIPGRRVYLSRMIVKSEFRNQGIGGVLIDFMCNLARKSGYSEMALGVDVVNKPARHLYAKKGFEEVLFHGEDQHGEFYKLLKNLY